MPKLFRPLVTELPQAAWLGLQQRIEKLETEWKAGGRPDWKEFTPDADERFRDVFAVELIKVDQEFRWRYGHRRRIEDYLAECDESVRTHRAIADLFYGECQTRQMFGDMPQAREWPQRFPESASRIEVPPVGLDASASASAAARPAPGSDTIAADGLETLPDLDRSIPSGVRFGRYVLLEPLGDGAMGKVFRAYDTRLHRHVALKVPIVMRHRTHQSLM